MAKGTVSTRFPQNKSWQKGSVELFEAIIASDEKLWTRPRVKRVADAAEGLATGGTNSMVNPADIAEAIAHELSQKYRG